MCFSTIPQTRATSSSWTDGSWRTCCKESWAVTCRCLTCSPVISPGDKISDLIQDVEQQKQLDLLVNFLYVFLSQVHRDPQRVEAIMSDLDMNMDGSVSFEEFVAMVTELTVCSSSFFQDYTTPVVIKCGQMKDGQFQAIWAELIFWFEAPIPIFTLSLWILKMNLSYLKTLLRFYHHTTTCPTLQHCSPATDADILKILCMTQQNSFWSVLKLFSLVRRSSSTSFQTHVWYLTK